MYINHSKMHIIHYIFLYYFVYIKFSVNKSVLSLAHTIDIRKYRLEATIDVLTALL